MSRVREYLISRGAQHLLERVGTYDVNSTPEMAAHTLGCDPTQVAKSLSFVVKKAMTKPEQKEHKRKLEEARKVAEAQGLPPPESLGDDGTPIVIVASHDAKVSTPKFREMFGCKPNMPKREDVERLIGYPVGAVGPFGVNDGVQVYLDVSLKRFDYVYPSAGTVNSGMKVSPAEIEQYATNLAGWVDLCDGWQDTDVAPKVAAKE